MIDLVEEVMLEAEEQTRDGIRKKNWVRQRHDERTRENNTEEFPMKDQAMMHMIAIKPDGAVELKKNMCSCSNCLEGMFLKCYTEKGMLFCSSETCVSEDEDEDDEDENYEGGYV